MVVDMVGSMDGGGMAVVQRMKVSVISGVLDCQLLLCIGAGGYAGEECTVLTSP